MTATKISQKHHETLARKHINFSAQKRKFTSSKALNSLSLTLIHSPTLPIPFISSICTSFTFSSGSARTMIAWAEKEHENGYTFVSRSTERSPLHARSPIFRAKGKWSEKHWKKDPHSTLYTETKLMIWIITCKLQPISDADRIAVQLRHQ